MSGTLYLVSTPIGNEEDISLRALRILREVDIIVCEEFKEGRRLLAKFEIHKPLETLNEHNERASTRCILDRLHEGKNIAVVSDSGTPVFSDPGQFLVREVIAANLKIVPIPGANSLLPALIASGFPIDNFLFFGWFRRCVHERGKLRYARHAPNLHTFFGWLQVAEVVPLVKLGQKDLGWARGHPHFWGERGTGNTLYLAAERFTAEGAPREARDLPGAGLFPRFDPRLCLTARPGFAPRSLWQLPEWIHTPGRVPLLSHHQDPGRWSRNREISRS